MKTTIIIPTYNEAENIEPIMQEIFKYLPDANILIIDDDSTDDTGKIATLLSQANHKIRFISRKGKARSFAQSYIEGFKEALKNNTDYIIQMDADFSHDPKYLPEMLEKLKNHDVVIGSRYIRGGKVENWPFWRRFLSHASNIYARLVVILPLADPTAGFIGWKRESLEKINLDKISSSGYAFLIEMKFYAHKSGLKMKEVPIIFADRKFGASKMNKKLILEAALFCWKLRFKKIKNQPLKCHDCTPKNAVTK
ncbi:polyprenol monophosphomannose synthase [Patescibacteria group bacterium]|nr:polyprenol monophosphomannose synthase [Patescibacteria group bacterium]MBU4368434.1 polyprenol monophosphomannose synthase [Patescibacteria group bacterium]